MTQEKTLMKSWKYFGFEVSSNFRNRLASFSIEHRSDSERNWLIGICIPFLFALYLKFHLPSKLKKTNELSISFFSGSIWFKFWTDPMEGKTKCIDFVDIFLGKRKCDIKILEEKQVEIPMPEKSYDATAKLELFTWSRPRWFDKKMKRVDIKIDEGIPHEGKGENSFDCGVDATFGICTGECNSITKGVGILVGDVLSTRIRYGGWKDYKWTK